MVKRVLPLAECGQVQKGMRPTPASTLGPIQIMIRGCGRICARTEFRAHAGVPDVALTTLVLVLSMLRIFVSSTSKDLQHHRDVVRDVILEQRWHPVMMEQFGTSTETQPSTSAYAARCACDLNPC